MYPAGFAYPCQTLAAAAAAAGASGGAVGGVVTVDVDCCYGPCKISLLVVKNSKKKREKIMHRGLETSASQVLCYDFGGVTLNPLQSLKSFVRYC